MLARKTEAGTGLAEGEVCFMVLLSWLRLDREMVRIGDSLERRMGDGELSEVGEGGGVGKAPGMVGSDGGSTGWYGCLGFLRLNLLCRLEGPGGNRARVHGVERAAVKKVAICGEA